MPSEITTYGAVLFELERGPGCGAELIERIHKRTNSYVKLVNASVYATLKRMEKDRLISGTAMKSATRGGRPKMVYQLTSHGKVQADAEREALRGLLNGPVLLLEAGKYYRSRDGELWCCFRIDEGYLPEGQAAMCVRVSDQLVESFYMDGRYDPDSLREHCLTPVPVPYKSD